jgi:FMN-dependent NADH-azoreductase
MNANPDATTTPSPQPITRLLWVEASPKGPDSLSSQCARAFLGALGTLHEVEVEHLDLWQRDIVEFDGDAATAKFARLFREPLTEAQQAKWDAVQAEIDWVETFDAIVMSVPMWNWSIPHRLKQWLDTICQPIRSFTVDASGRHVGVLGVGKVAQLILTRSSAYDGRSPEMQDFQRPYLEYLLGTMLGYQIADTLVIEPTTRFTPAERETVRTDAITAANATADDFAQLLRQRHPA